MVVQSVSEFGMDDKDLLQRRRLRQQRLERARGARKAGLMASPLAGVFCMLIALGSIIAYWRGFPSWALLALGFGAVLVLMLGTFFLRARRK